MKNKNNHQIINQSIPSEFSSTLVQYKVEHNQNISSNYNPAEIMAMREEQLRIEQENVKRQKMDDFISKSKKNISKYNNQNVNDSTNSFSSTQRGKEYNENLRKKMKMKSQKQKLKDKSSNKDSEFNLKNYEQEFLPTFSFKESLHENNSGMDMDGNLYNEFYNNNMQIHSSNYINQNPDNSAFCTKTLANNFYVNNNNLPQNNIDNIITENIREEKNNEVINLDYYNDVNNNNDNNNNLYKEPKNQPIINNKSKNIQQQINNNLNLIQNFRKNGLINNDTITSMNNNFNTNYESKLYDKTINKQNFIGNNQNCNNDFLTEENPYPSSGYDIPKPDTKPIRKNFDISYKNN